MSAKYKQYYIQVTTRQRSAYYKARRQTGTNTSAITKEVLQSETSSVHMINKTHFYQVNYIVHLLCTLDECKLSQIIEWDKLVLRIHYGEA